MQLVHFTKINEYTHIKFLTYWWQDWQKDAYFLKLLIQIFAWYFYHLGYIIKRKPTASY